jgi:hypothetical protein
LTRIFFDTSTRLEWGSPSTIPFRVVVSRVPVPRLETRSRMTAQIAKCPRILSLSEPAIYPLKIYNGKGEMAMASGEIHPPPPFLSPVGLIWNRAAEASETTPSVNPPDIDILYSRPIPSLSVPLLFILLHSVTSSGRFGLEIKASFTNT